MKRKAILSKTALLRDSFGTFTLKIISIGLGYISTLLLARLIGAKGYGIYAYAIAWVGLLGVPGVMGLDRLLVRDLSVYHSQSAWGLMRGLLYRANQVVLLVSLILSSFMAIVVWTLGRRFTPEMVNTFYVALILLPLTSLIYIRQATMRGLHRVVIGQAPEMLIRPIMFIALIVCTYIFLGQRLSIPWIVGMNVLAAGVAFLIGTVQVHKALPDTLKEAFPVYQTNMWLRSALPLIFISGMQLINTKIDIIMLGVIKGSETAGVYVVANRCAGLISFVLLAVNTAFGPVIAKRYASKEIIQLQREVTHSARVILLFALSIAVVLILFGDRILSIFGTDFIRGQRTLTILSIGYLINAATGSVGLILTMTGHEREAAWGISVGTITGVILNVLLIPPMGMEGAATATASSMIIWNVILVWFVWKRLRIHSTALGDIRLLRVEK